jgi:hypothetical protein
MATRTDISGSLTFQIVIALWVTVDWATTSVISGDHKDAKARRDTVPNFAALITQARAVSSAHFSGWNV